MNLLAAYKPFLDPLPIWDYWPLLLLPLVVAVSVVYKSIKCKSMTTVPREAAGITFWILLGMICAAAGLCGIVVIVNHV
jgi:hypothetical protein